MLGFDKGGHNGKAAVKNKNVVLSWPMDSVLQVVTLSAPSPPPQMSTYLKAIEKGGQPFDILKDDRCSLKVLAGVVNEPHSGICRISARVYVGVCTQGGGGAGTSRARGEGEAWYGEGEEKGGSCGVIRRQGSIPGAKAEEEGGGKEGSDAACISAMLGIKGTACLREGGRGTRAEEENATRGRGTIKGSSPDGGASWDDCDGGDEAGELGPGGKGSEEKEDAIGRSADRGEKDGRGGSGNGENQDGGRRSGRRGEMNRKQKKEQSKMEHWILVLGGNGGLSGYLWWKSATSSFAFPNSVSLEVVRFTMTTRDTKSLGTVQTQSLKQSSRIGGRKVRELGVEEWSHQQIQTIAFDKCK
ncbi:hypothetical protein OG21DRAFT_1526584 [Imleria badia]|nr:hypothetical protein OG21DRAFT_1526584 [Imleria badia]